VGAGGGAVPPLRGASLLRTTAPEVARKFYDSLDDEQKARLDSHASGRVKTAQGAAMPRSMCSPSGTSGAVASAATAPEISTDRPTGRHSPSSRLTRLTAGPMAVKSSRSTAPILPHRISPRCSFHIGTDLYGAASKPCSAPGGLEEVLGF
jgi:hypothetical protein